MEEITAGVMAAEPEAPPGDAAAVETPVAVAEAPAPSIDVTTLPNFDDPAATEAWIAASTAATNAQAEAEETVAEAPPPETTAEVVETAAAPLSEPEPKPAEQPDYAAILADLQAKGFKVEPPAPPPDPYEALTAQLAPHVGTAEAYAAAKTLALTPVEDTDPEWGEKVAARDAAAAQVRAFDQSRQVTDLAQSWAQKRVMGQLGSALELVPTKYGLDPARAQRVLQPTAMTDAIDAVAEAVTARTNAEWQAKYDARERYWEGKVKQAGTDRTAENVRRMGAAPQPGAASGARPAGPGPIWEADPTTGLPSEAWIQKAIHGQLAGVDLS